MAYYDDDYDDYYDKNEVDRRTIKYDVFDIIEWDYEGALVDRINRAVRPIQANVTREDVEDDEDEDKLSKIVEMLSHPDADVNSQDMRGLTLLHYFAYHRWYRPLFQALLRHPKINVNIQDNKGATPLHLAAFGGFVNSIQLLLAHPKINPNMRTYYGFTPLHFAAYKDNKLSLQELLAHPKINVNVRSSQGETPLHLAVKHEKIDVMKHLLAHPKINVNVRNRRDRMTPLHLTVYSASRNLMAKMLLAHPRINVNIKDKYGKTFLAVAADFSHVNLVKLAFAHPDTDPDILDNAGENALARHLTRTYLNKDSPTVEQFLDAGAFSEYELKIIERKYPITWEKYKQKFYQTQKALDEGPLSGLPSVISSVIAEALRPGVLFWGADSKEE